MGEVKEIKKGKEQTELEAKKVAKKVSSVKNDLTAGP